MTNKLVLAALVAVPALLAPRAQAQCTFTGTDGFVTVLDDFGPAKPTYVDLAVFNPDSAGSFDVTLETHLLSSPQTTWCSHAQPELTYSLPAPTSCGPTTVNPWETATFQVKVLGPMVIALLISNGVPGATPPLAYEGLQYLTFEGDCGAAYYFTEPTRVQMLRASCQ